MSYSEIYHRFAKSTPHIGRNDIRDAVSAVTGIPKFQPILSAALDIKVCRGYYLSPRSDHPLVTQFGRHIIVLARDLNRCWMRFVLVKELMHLLDGAVDAADTGEKFEALLTEFTGPVSGVAWSSQTLSEFKAFWMALGLFCPAPVHRKLLAARKSGHISDYAIAVQLRIPEVYVPNLFTAAYKNNLTRILK